MDVPHGPPGRPAAAHPARNCCAATRATAPIPILRERTPVRMDLTHCGWSDIFFLGMDFPEGAKVLNVSIDLGVHGRDAAPRPPVEAYLRVIEEPVLRLVSVDLGATADITNLAEVFDFAKDYLGLLKAAVIAAGIVPPGIEGSGQSLAELLARIVGPGPRPGDRQQRQQHPERLAPGGLDQPARRADQRLHARHRPGRVAHRASCRSTSAGWCWRARCSANGSAAPAAAGRIPAASGRA